MVSGRQESNLEQPGGKRVYLAENLPFTAKPRYFKSNSNCT